MWDLSDLTDIHIKRSITFTTTTANRLRHLWVDRYDSYHARGEVKYNRVAFLRCLQTVSSREVEGRGPEGVFQGGNPVRYRDEYRGEQSSTIEMRVPRHAIPPSAYNLSVVCTNPMYTCKCDDMCEYTALPYTYIANREGALPFVRSSELRLGNA